MKIFFYTAIGFLTLFSTNVLAMGSGHSLGANLVFISPAQDDLDTLIDRANARAGGISTKPFGQAYEFAAQYQYRFSGTIFAMVFRPSYFTQSTKGSGGGSDYNYSLSGWTFFPMLRIYPLENNFIRFFMQLGIGYGQLTGEIEEGSASTEFKGSNFGALGGLGAEFCFTDAHCMVLEGNLRYLPMERNLPKSSSGTFAGDSVDPSGTELEMSGRDVKTTMSGVQAILGYMFNF